MPLINDITKLCSRLAPLGWHELLLAVTNQALNIRQNSPAALQVALLRSIPSINRQLPGFEDFAPSGAQGVTAASPAKSLLYHALASPLVVRDHLGRPLSGHATPAELDLLENFIYSLAPVKLASFVTENGGASKVALVVFSSEYRPASDSVDGQHADLVFSRTGIARVGTARAKYLPENRGFWPEDQDNPTAMRVIPSKYSVWLAVKKKGREIRVSPILDNSFGQDTNEPNLDFWIPMHKVFPGNECLADATLEVGFERTLFNLKIQRIHRFLGTTPLPTGFPYVLRDEEIAGLAQDPELGPGWLVPAVHPSLVAPAFNNGVAVTFKVKKANVDDFAAFTPGVRGVPEYVHARSRVTTGGIEDLNDHVDLIKEMKRKDYQALHYVDFSGEGWVTAVIEGLPATGAPPILPAYALVSAPDFFPASGQYELSEWSRSAAIPAQFKDQLWNIEPTPLSEMRLPANLQLPGTPFKQKDVTMTAVVSMGPRAATQALWPAQRDALRSSALPDDASGVFAPGWDVSFDELNGSTHLASYSLGSPFPEDAKLCAALSTFWPAVAPDVFRTFVNVPGNTQGTIAPLTDAEIGQSGDTPWDGVTGPRVLVQGGEEVVEFPVFLNADYVRLAMQNRFSVRLTARLTAEGYQERVLVACRAYSVLGNLGDLKPARDNWLMLSFREVAPGDPALQAAQNQSGQIIAGNAYGMTFCRIEPQSERVNARTARMPLKDSTEFFASAESIWVLRKRPGTASFNKEMSES